MNATITIDKAGRVVLPKAIRDGLHLSPGDALELTVKDEEVTLRPQRAAQPMRKERGVWVLRTGKPLSEHEARQMLEKLREERTRAAVQSSM